MKSLPSVHFVFLLSVAAWTLAGDPVATHAAAAGPQTITVSTAHSALTLRVGEDGRLYQLGYGGAEEKTSPIANPPRATVFYPQFGDGFILEPALQVTHADGNTSTDLRYVKHDTQTLDTNVTLTRIELKDSFYPFFVTLCLKTYRDEDIIQEWAEIHHEEDGPVTLYHYDSASPLFRAKEYWLTQFHGDTPVPQRRNC